MEGIAATTVAGSTTVIPKAAVDELCGRLRGRLLREGDAGYDTSRTVWNALIDRRPALIARCAGVSDVMHAVDFARLQRVPIAVRGGGHNIAGTAVCDQGLMLDLSGMKGIRVHPTRRTAWASPLRRFTKA